MIMIDELQICMPGMSEEEGWRLGRQVAQLVGEKLPAGASPQQLNTLDVSAVVQTGMTEDQLANALAEQIVKQLKIALKINS